MSDLPEPTVTASRYEVSLLPEGDINYPVYVIYVENRGRDRWAVVRHRMCMDTAGAWDWESIPSERTDEWLAGHRFPLDEALTLAMAAAPRVNVNGRTAAEVYRAATQPATCQCIPASPMAPRIYADCCLPAASPTP